MKRKRTMDFSINDNKKKYKYEFIKENDNKIVIHPDGTKEYLDNDKIPIHYIKDRMVSEKEINNFYDNMNRKQRIFKEIPEDTLYLLESLPRNRYNAVISIMNTHIDNNESIEFIYEEIESWLDIFIN